MRAVSSESTSPEKVVPEKVVPEKALPLGRKISIRRMVLLIALGAVAIDIFLKCLAVAKITVDQPISVIGDFFTLRLLRNSGAAFSLGTNSTVFLTVVALLVAIAIIKFSGSLTSRWWGLCLGLILGGACGNLVDRFFRAPGPFRGGVIDYLSFGSFPVFNFADSCVTCGAAGLVFLTLLGKDGTESATRHDQNAVEKGERDA